ncbi:MAG: hypothetical protein Q9191_002979 [Dirinaria sp. TL-2023a]
MPPPNDDATSSTTRREDPSNPFIGFRRFADEQMASVLHTIFGQPPKSKVAQPSSQDADLPWIAQAMTDEQRRRLRRMHEELPPSAAYGRPTNPFHDPEERKGDARGSEDEPRKCPYRPAHQEVPERNRNGPPPELAWKPFYDDDNVESALPQEGPSSCFGWWDEYLYFSKYSPVLLEEADGLKQGSMKWRQAFEDLIAVQDGRPLPPPDASEPPSFLDRWAGAMELGNPYRMSLRDAIEAQEKSEARWRSIVDGSYEPEDNLDEDTDVDGDNDDKAFEDARGPFDYVECCAPTEQDLGGYILKDPTLISSPLMKSLWREAFRKEHYNEIEGSGTSATDTLSGFAKPGITSTLTTTERTTLPDGTVHTKMVLKKRFADGREESAETTHTTHGHQEQPPKQVESKAKTEKVFKHNGEEKPKEQVKEKKKTGWFWN